MIYKQKGNNLFDFQSLYHRKEIHMKNLFKSNRKRKIITYSFISKKNKKKKINKTIKLRKIFNNLITS